MSFGSFGYVDTIDWSLAPVPDYAAGAPATTDRSRRGQRDVDLAAERKVENFAALLEFDHAYLSRFQITEHLTELNASCTQSRSPKV